MSNKFIEFFKNIASTKKSPAKEKEFLKKIENGFKNNEFKMYLQFIVDNKTKKLVSAEALSRWVNAEGEVIMPGKYIRLMEKTGIIVKFDYYMFEKVCKKLSEWKNTEFSEFSIFCNFTRITISQKDFVKRIKAIADKYDFNREQLFIEITEDTMESNFVIAKQNIIKVKQLGFGITLDDMGSGYNSLISICDYPFDIVKIDRKILLLTKDKKGESLFLEIISLAHNLNLKVVCEGVETEEQNSLVSSSECDYIQGWYYSKELPKGKVEEFAKEYMSRFS